MKEYIHYLASPLGIIEIQATDAFVTSIQFVEEEELSNTSTNAVIELCARQLEEYFTGERKTFDLPLNPEGTDFQKEVWQAVSDVPFGKTVSYLDIANILGDKHKTRAVGMSNGKNPLLIIVPCHRIIGADGSLTGYAGGLDKKKWLLRHEGAAVVGQLELI